MFGRYNTVLFWTLLCGSYGFLPDYSKEYFTEDALDLSHDPERVKYLQENYEHKPLFCRADVCLADYTTDTHKGTFHWPVTQVGTIVQLRCPYAINTHIYASRHCVVRHVNKSIPHPFGLNETQGLWANPVIDQCPDPPLTVLLKTLTSASPPMDAIKWYTDAIHKIHYTLVTYKEPHVFNEDITAMATLVMDAALAALLEETALSTETLKDAFEIIDIIFLFNRVRNNFLQHNLDKEHLNKFLQSMIILCEMWTPVAGETESTFVGKYFTIMAVQPAPEENNTYTFDRTEWGNQYVNWFFPTILTVYGKWYMPTTVTVSGKFNEGQVLHFLYLTHYKFITQELNKMLAEPSDGRMKRQVAHTVITQRKKFNSFEPVTAIVYISMSKSSAAFGGKLKMWDNIRESDDINVTLSSSYLPDVLGLKSPPVCGDISIARAFQYDITRFNASRWLEGSCLTQEEMFPQPTTCTCSGYGLYTVFGIPLRSDASIGEPGDNDTDEPSAPSEGSSFSEFLGFPYNNELYIVGHVLRALSLVCLIVTLLSYVVFRKARHGTPTRVLLNLCVTLILLLVVLYVADKVAGSKWGCRMSNIFRYYLVMVSLMWNATEAVNMYLMLIRVFKSHVSKFVLKAALVSWGLPLVPIIIVLAITEEGFDGHYALDNCKFRCSMQIYVFYFAYLVPMSMIIVGNIVVFIMVVRVLVRNGSSAPSNAPGTERRSKSIIRLVGSISMMVLLGIPWIFSAFGAIDDATGNHSLSMLSGVFQVVSIVFINLQGVFIFLFHCVRNPDMRAQWMESLRSTSSTQYEGSSSGKSKGTLLSSVTSAKTKEPHELTDVCRSADGGDAIVTNPELPSTNNESDYL